MAKAAKLGYQEEYLQVLRKQKGDPAGRKAADEHLRHSYAHGDEGDIKWASTPVILDGQQRDTLEAAATTMGSIMEKVMRKYQRDRTFRALFGLDPTIEELTLVPSGCHAAVPLSRVDIFFDQKTLDFKILGIVTGGVDGMAANTEVNRALWQMGSFAEFASAHRGVESIDPVNECVLSIFHTYGNWANAEEGHNHPTHPSLAVVDVKNSPRQAETSTVINRMRDLGCYARATTFDQLRIETVGGVKQLVDNHGPITCVWLRATADEAAADMGPGVRDLLNATRRGMVCTVGGYRSWPCCTRTFLQVLHTKECQQLLSRDERAFIAAHVPEITILNAATDLSEFYDQENWLMRTADGHNAKSILAGADMRKLDWRKLLVKSIKRHDAVQHVLGHVSQDIMGVDEADEPFEATRDVMLGLYIFESKLCGIQASCGTGLTIAHWDDRLEMPCVTVRDEN